MYIRTMADTLQRLSKFFPILSLNGPRQAGKSTLVKMQFPHLPYISLENIDFKYEAQTDPRGFLAKYTNGAIFDEAHNVPHLFSYLQGIVDDSELTGRYILTGSQNFLLNEQITQSLAGRIGVSTLLPLSLYELGMPADINACILKGGYPQLHKLHTDTQDFYSSYLQTYIERDVRQIKNIENLGLFKKFLTLCATRVGQIVNLSSLAADSGISHTTARQWLNILEASYIVFFIQPYYRNFSKRLIKMPKMYFYDTGIACNLLGVDSISDLEKNYLRGALFENLVILEILKNRLNLGAMPKLYFWRDTQGHEIDLIAEFGGAVHAIEIKSGATFNPEYLKNINYFCKLAQGSEGPEIKGYVIYNGQQEGSIHGITMLPFSNIQDLLNT